MQIQRRTVNQLILRSEKPQHKICRSHACHSKNCTYNNAYNNPTDKDPCIIYRFFADELKGDNKLKILDEIWLEVKKIFLTFKYWYENHKLYHLIGYLNVLESKESEKSLVSLYKESSKKSKEDFMLFIEEQ